MRRYGSLINTNPFKVYLFNCSWYQQFEGGWKKNSLHCVASRRVWFWNYNAVLLALHALLNMTMLVTFVLTKYFNVHILLLIHVPDPQSRPVIITIFTCVCSSVLPHFSKNLVKQNKFQARIVISTGRTMGMAEGIMFSLFICILRSIAWHLQADEDNCRWDLPVFFAASA